MAKHIFNLKPHVKDERDYKLERLVKPNPAVVLPKSVDLRPECPPVYDQGQLGSCTANAGIAAATMLLNFPSMLSREFQYYMETFIEGDPGKDNGAQSRDIGQVMTTYGLCLDSLDPYSDDPAKFAIPPTDAMKADAKTRLIQSYYGVPDLNGIKQVLALKSQPVLIGITVYESFESDEVAKTGIVPMPDVHKEKVLGGHEVLVVGYDDDKKVAIVRNSWGAGWGMNGYFTLPYAYFEKKYSDGFFVLQN